MRAIILVFGFLLFTWVEVNSSPTSNETDVSGDSNQKENNEKINLSNIWANMRKALIKAWEHMKNLTTETIKKIENWIKNKGLLPKDLFEKIVNRLKELKEEMLQNLKEIAKESKEIANLVENCTKQHKTEIEKLIFHTMEEIGVCLLTVEENIFDDKFTQGEITNLDLCLKVENPEECFKYQVENHYKTNKYFNDNDMDKEKKSELRNKLLNCITNSMIKSSDQFSQLLIVIVQCVANGGKNPQLLK